MRLDSGLHGGLRRLCRVAFGCRALIGQRRGGGFLYALFILRLLCIALVLQPLMVGFAQTRFHCRAFLRRGSGALRSLRSGYRRILQRRFSGHACPRFLGSLRFGRRTRRAGLLRFGCVVQIDFGKLARFGLRRRALAGESGDMLILRALRFEPPRRVRFCFSARARRCRQFDFSRGTCRGSGSFSLGLAAGSRQRLLHGLFGSHARTGGLGRTRLGLCASGGSVGGLQGRLGTLGCRALRRLFLCCALVFAPHHLGIDRTLRFCKAFFFRLIFQPRRNRRSETRFKRGAMFSGTVRFFLPAQRLGSGAALRFLRSQTHLQFGGSARFGFQPFARQAHGLGCRLRVGLCGLARRLLGQFASTHHLQSFGLALRQRGFGSARGLFGTRALLGDGCHAAVGFNLCRDVFKRLGAGNFALLRGKCFGLEFGLGRKARLMRRSDTRMSRLQRLRFNLCTFLRPQRGFGIGFAPFIGQPRRLALHRHPHTGDCDSAFFGLDALLCLRDLYRLFLRPRARALGTLHVAVNAWLQGIGGRALRKFRGTFACRFTRSGFAAGGFQSFAPALSFSEVVV